MPYLFKSFIFSIVLCFSVTLSFAQKKFEVNDLVKLVGISDPQISPDGKSIVIVISRADTILNRYNTELVVVDIANT